jgi:hypothetical protein
VATVQAWSEKVAGPWEEAAARGRSVTPSTDLGEKTREREGVGSLLSVQPVHVAEAASVSAPPLSPPQALNTLPAPALPSPSSDLGGKSGMEKVAGTSTAVTAVPPTAGPPSVTALTLPLPPALDTSPAPALSTHPALPSFILRRLAARKAEREGAARYVRHVALLVAEMARRGAEPARSWPAQPFVERLPPSLAAEVQAVGRALRQSLALSHRKQEARRSRRQSSGERKAFWAGYEATLVRDPLKAVGMAQ